MRRVAIACASASLVLAAGLLLGGYWLTVLAVAIVYALACLSLVVLTGWTGQLNLHVAALGLGWGAYAAFALAAAGLPPAAAIVFAGIATVPFAGLVGAVAVRFRGLELAVATIAIGLIFERLAFRNIAKLLAPRSTSTFESSFVAIGRPSFAAGDAAFFVFCVAVAALLFVAASRVHRGATGRSLRALREREAASETLGIPVVRYRVGAFAGSIAIAATAGALLAALKQGIAPDTFNIDLSFRLLAAAVIGGIASVRGAIIGGALLALLPEVTQLGPLKLFGGERLFLVFGIGMVLTLWRLPGGLASLLPERARSRPDDTAHPVALPEARTRNRTALRTGGVRVRFGGVTALDGVDISVRTGEIAAIIGPNGAGKSTLFNVVSGLVVPEDGRVYLDGEDVTELAASRRAARGLARTFQTVEVFRGMTVRENLETAAHLLAPASALAEAFGLPPARRAERTRARRAGDLIAELGLEDVADLHADDLPLGLLRVLEAGMALASNPRVLLLDEPSAGLDAEETRTLGETILRARAARGIAVLVVEHDMSLVEQLAERVYVLDFGRVIAEGSPAAVRRDPIVVERYLGADEEELVDARA